MIIIEILLIRHSKTKGNLERRYIGKKTDENLCNQGIELLEKNKKQQKYEDVQIIFSSPMIRCIETAKIIYGDRNIEIEEGLAECDFGDFENKNYNELKNDEYYKKWLNSFGQLDFPHGENINYFKKRTTQAFEGIVNKMIKENIDKSAIIVHGGTIMAIMEKYSSNQSYYDYQVQNGAGYKIIIDNDLWQRDKKIASRQEI